MVAASGGNHGAAVAYAAQKLGIKSHIFVPELSGKTKIELIKRTGASLTIVPGTYAEALKHEKKLMKVDIHHKKNDESMLNYYIAMDYKSKDDPLKKEQAYFEYDLRF